MATLVIPQTLQIVAEAQSSGQPIINVLHFRYSGGIFDGTTTLAAFKTAWEKAGGPLKLKYTGVAMVGYKLTDLNTDNGTVHYLGSSTAGGVTTTLSTMASAALVKLGGGTRDRSGSGRLYHGPLSEIQINSDGRTVESGFVTSLTSAYTTFKADMAAAGMEWVVASRVHSQANPITSISVSNIVATQRRRLR